MTFAFIMRKGKWLHLLQGEGENMQEWRASFTSSGWKVECKWTIKSIPVTGGQMGQPNYQTIWAAVDDARAESAVAAIPEEHKVAAFAAAIEESR